MQAELSSLLATVLAAAGRLSVRRREWPYKIARGKRYPEFKNAMQVSVESGRVRASCSARRSSKAGYPELSASAFNMKFSVCPLAIAGVLACALLSACTEPNEQTRLASARAYLEKRDPKSAVIELKNVLAKDGNSAEARFLLGRALIDSENPTAALVELRKARDLKYPDERLSAAMAKALLQQGRVKEVTDEYALTSLAEPAAQAELKTVVAQAFDAQSKGVQAEQALREALSAVPDYGPALLQQARHAAAGGDMQKALALVHRVLANAPQDADALLSQANLLRLSKVDDMELIEAYRKVLAVRKDDLTAHSALITIFAAKQDYAQAGKQLDALREVRPNHLQTKLLEAKLASQRGDLKTARENAQLLLKWAPDLPAVLEVAGVVALQSGSPVEAQQQLSKALQLAPGLDAARLALAQAFLKTGDGDRASSTIQPLLAVRDPKREVLAVAAEIELAKGGKAKAQELLERAIDKNPSDGRLRTALALAHLDTGEDVPAVVQELQAIAASDAGTSADMALINAALQRRDFDGALKAVDGLEKKLPRKAAAYDLRGAIWMLQGDRAAARKAFERSVDLEPAGVPAAQALAGLDLQDGHPEVAEKRFDAALKSRPDDAEALIGLARVRTAIGKKAPEVGPLLEKAVKLRPELPAPRLALIEHRLMVGDARGALSAAQDAVGAMPNNTLLGDALARSQAANGDANQAVATYNKLVNEQPKFARAYLGLADIYVTQGKSADAIQSLERALAQEPNLLAAQVRLATLYRLTNRSQEALALGKKMQSQLPGRSAGYIVEGDASASLKDWPRAIEGYRTALKKEPTSPGAIKLHAALWAANNPGAAETFANEWLRDNPQDAAFVLYLAGLSLAKKDYARAEPRLLRAVELQPTNAYALNNLAWVQLQLDKPGALDNAEKANRLQPDQPQFLDTWAAALAKRGQFDRAIEAQRRALDLQPRNPLLQLSLARIYVQAGQKAQARNQLDQLTQLGNGFAGHKEVETLKSQL